MGAAPEGPAWVQKQNYKAGGETSPRGCYRSNLRPTVGPFHTGAAGANESAWARGVTVTVVGRGQGLEKTISVVGVGTGVTLYLCLRINFIPV